MKCNLEVKEEHFGAMLFLLPSVSCRQTCAVQTISPDEVPSFNTEKMHIWSSLHFLKTVLLIWQYIFPQTKKKNLQLFIHSCPLESSLPSVFLGFALPYFFPLVLFPLCATEGLYYTLSHSQIMQGIVNMLKTLPAAKSRALRDLA